jgi:hypothetical protein
VATADFNNDCNLGLPTANFSAQVSVLLGDGQGGFGATSHFAGLGGYLTALAVGDFNNDGNLDLATVGNQTIVLLGNGDGTFQPPVNIGLLNTTPASLLSVAAADFQRLRGRVWNGDLQSRRN